MLLNSEMRPREKSLALAYIMLIGGHLGVHRFYLRRTATAVTQLVLFVVALLGYFTLLISSGFDPSSNVTFVGLTIMCIAGVPLFIWIIIDLFMIPRMVRQLNTQTEQEILQQLERIRNNPQSTHQRETSAPSAQPPYHPLDLSKR